MYFNEQDGMTISDDDDLFCVEIDSDTPTATYQNYIESYEGTPRSLNYDISQTFTTTTSKVGQSKLNVGYNYLDEMLSADTDEEFVRNFVLPQPDLFGFCDNYKSVEFLKDL